MTASSSEVGAEEDGDRVGLPLLVEGPQAVAQEALGGLQIARCTTSISCLDPLPLELGGLWARLWRPASSLRALARRESRA